MSNMASDGVNTLRVLGQAAGLDDELSEWLMRESREINAVPAILVVAILRDFMKSNRSVSPATGDRRFN